MDEKFAVPLTLGTLCRHSLEFCGDVKDWDVVGREEGISVCVCGGGGWGGTHETSFISSSLLSKHSPSLISCMVSVTAKHHNYIQSKHRIQRTLFSFL